MSVDYAHALIAYTASGDKSKPEREFQVLVGLWPDNTGWSEPFASTAGACSSDWNDGDDASRRARLFTTFHALVVREKLDAQVVHKALLAIDEYRHWISRDIEGAED